MADDLFKDFDAESESILFANGYTRTAFNGQVRWLTPDRNDKITREEALARVRRAQAPAPPERQDPSAED